MNFLLILLILTASQPWLILNSLGYQELVQLEQSKGVSLYRNSGLGVQLSPDLYPNAYNYNLVVINGEIELSSEIEIETEYFFDEASEKVKFISYKLSPISTVLEEAIKNKISDSNQITKMLNEEGASSGYQKKISTIITTLKKELEGFEVIEEAKTTFKDTFIYQHEKRKVSVNYMKEGEWYSKVNVYVSFD